MQKLRWARETGSEQQRGDVAAVLRAQQDALDWKYLEHWADVLGVGASLAKLRGVKG